VLAAWVAVSAQAADPIADLLKAHQLDLAADGKAFLLNEGGRASFVLVGGLHGDRETLALVQTLVAGLEPFGYRNVAAEMSPWAAARLPGGVVKGADIEEVQPHLLIRELAASNPQNGPLAEMVDTTKSGYRRSSAPQLLQLARDIGDVKDVTVGGASLRSLIVKTLEVESIRAAGNQRFDASTRREAVMKELFAGHYRAAAREQATPKFVVSFGQSHLGRGIDQRGVSTLGNFIAELAAAEGTQSFHVILFAAGGRIAFHGLQDIDQRKDNEGFAFIGSVARYPAAVFDLRPIRRALRSASSPLSPRDESLRYWADSYDAIVCYREVTPLGGSPKP
jgi:hypothetical protein